MDKITEAGRGQSSGYDEAYREGYESRADHWRSQNNPYKQSTLEYAGFADGVVEALIFA